MLTGACAANQRRSTSKRSASPGCLVQLMERRAFALVTDEDYSDLAMLVCGILKRQLRSCGQCRISEAATREGNFPCPSRAGGLHTDRLRGLKFH
jgi:hypothetical protein